MNWFFYAVLCAFFYGIEGVYLKYLNRQGIDEGTLVFAMFFYSLPFLFVPAFMHGIHPVGGNFLFYVVLVVIANGLGFLYYSKSIKNTEVSLAVPVLSLSPLVVVPFSWIFMRELPPVKGILGIVIIGFGLAALSAGTAGSGGTSLKLFFKNKGVRFALLTVLIWGVSANLDKIALRYSHPLVYPLITSAGISIFYSFFTAPSRIFNKKYFLLFLGLGFVNAGLFLSHMLALNTGYVSYLIAVKRSGMLIAVLLGWLLFKEKNPGLKFLASVFIIAGIFLLVK